MRKSKIFTHTFKDILKLVGYEVPKPISYHQGIITCPFCGKKKMDVNIDHYLGSCWNLNCPSVYVSFSTSNVITAYQFYDKVTGGAGNHMEGYKKLHKQPETMQDDHKGGVS